MGGGDVNATGLPYMGIIHSRYFDTSPIKLEISSFNAVSGEIDIVITMLDPEYNLDNATLKLRAIEDGVATYDEVTRDIINVPFSLSGQNSLFGTSETFVYPGGVDTNEIQAVAFVQLDDHTIIQSVCTYPVPDYRARIAYSGDQVIIGPSEGITNTEYFSVFNTGLDEDFTISVMMDDGPDNSLVTFCDDNDNCYPEMTIFSAGHDEESFFYANIIPGAAGMIQFHFEVTSDNMEDALIFPLTYISDDVQVLLVDDDGGEDFENYFTDALDDLGISYGLWDLASAKLTADLIPVFSTIIWNVGWAFPSVDEMDREFLEQYLDAGGNLFLSGQDIGWDLNESSDNVDTDFYHNYLHANYLSDDVNWYDLEGVDEDPVSNDLALHIAGGDGANNQDYPSNIAAYDDSAVEILDYTNGVGSGAIRATHPGANGRLVYFAFGYEAIDNPEDRTQTMAQVMAWLMAGGGNFVPIITGLTEEVVILLGETWDVSLDDLTVMDFDNVYPQDFTLTVLPGFDYSVEGTTVTPADDFVGYMEVNLLVNDGEDDSDEFAAPVLVYLEGDINADAVVDILDIVRMVNLILNLQTPGDWDWLAGDMNGDGMLNILDVIRILNVVLGNAQRESAGSAVLTYGKGIIQVSSAQGIAGIQLELKENAPQINWSLPSGWEVYSNDTRILLVSIDGSGFSSGVIAAYAGNLSIDSVISGDWNGEMVQTEVLLAPDHLELTGAFPNPFNPVTNLVYQLPEATQVNLSIYDLQGRLVSQLIHDAWQSAGTHEQIWLAHDFTSGIYLARLTAGNETQTQKLVLVK